MSEVNDAESAGAEMLIECDEALDVSVASDFKALLQQATSQNALIVLDASKIERIDGAALQLMTAFFLEVEESGLNVTWRNPTEALQYSAKLTGLNDVLRL